jgi:transglutaminase-like putative cysteine protease
MKLQVFHRTRYQYASPVSDSFNEARLRPTDVDDQRCERFLLKVLPATRLSHYLDFQRNYVHLFDVSEPHTELVVEATSVVETSDARRLAEDLVTTPLTAMAECARLEGCHDFLQGSRYVELTPAAWRLALDATAGVTDVWQATQALSRHIHREFSYQPATTNVHTPMAEVLQNQRGVCQDFAHVLIGMCRSLRIPARYVSGYLYNGPTDQLRGAQASHAWVEVFLPGLGWRGLDPTNGAQPDARYVKIGTGRDYADVSPLRGTYRGTPQRKMTVEVLVSALEPVPALT